jgi:hypothetical protein
VTPEQSASATQVGWTTTAYGLTPDHLRLEHDEHGAAHIRLDERGDMGIRIQVDMGRYNTPEQHAADLERDRQGLLRLAAVATLVSHVQIPDETPHVPEIMIWVATLPVWQKLIIIFVAMTVEEGFFRAFLQSRFGWIPSSLLFALGQDPELGRMGHRVDHEQVVHPGGGEDRGLPHRGHG